MPFLGVVHHNARQVIGSCIPHLPARAHVICSGNFTLEATLRLNGYTGFLSGSDVSLYTCTLGAYFAGKDEPLAMNTALFPELEPLAAYLDTPEGRAAVVSLALDVLPVYPRKNLFQTRMFKHYARSWAEKVEKTIAKLKVRKAMLQLNEFHARDGWERALEIPAGCEDVVLTFPPTYEGGYEKLYKAMDALFAWHAPAYKILTTGTEFAARVVERDGPWIIGTEKRDQAMDDVLGEPFADAPRDTKVRISLYTNIPEISPKVVRRQVSVKEPPWPRFTDHDEIREDSKLTVHRVDSSHANYIRQVYASVEIGQASAAYSYAVAVDGKCIGILLFQDPTFGMKIEGETRADTTMYMMADIAVASVRYPRLSKLLLRASTSKELRRDLEGRTVREIEFIVTSAFSRNPVSMKYRGLYKLLTRKQEPSGIYILNYYSHAGLKTLPEALAAWRSGVAENAPVVEGAPSGAEPEPSPGTGGFVTFPPGTTAILHGDEQVVPLVQLGKGGFAQQIGDAITKTLGGGKKGKKK